MGKAWPIGPNDEPVGWFDRDLEAEDDGEGRYSVRKPRPYRPNAPKWIRASLLGWTAFFLSVIWWTLKLAWIAFYFSGLLFVIASYVTYRAARSHIDDLMGRTWEEQIQRTKRPTR